MALKFRKPEVKQQRLKAMFYGEMGSGKSTCACQFPMTAYIDTEDTASKKKYAKMIEANGGAVLSTGDFNEILGQIKELMSTQHEFKTLVIDSLTIPYENLVAECEKKIGSEFGRHIGEANKRMKLLVNLLLRIDMNVIITCQAKKEYGNNMSVIGQTYNCYNRLGYMFDLVFETQVRGNKYIAITKKSRLDEFPMNEQFEFTYLDVIKRYGNDVIERKVKTEHLASPEQVKELQHLLEVIKLPEETLDKWLDKANAETIEELTEDEIKKCINSLKDKIQGDTK